MNKVFIPIKHESQRVPRKNFRIFGDEPLWKRLLLKLINNNFEIYVDTDSQEILNCDDHRFNSVNFISREEHLIGDDIPVNELLLNFVNNYCSKQDKVIQVHTTSPFLKVFSIIEAFELLNYNDSVATFDKIQSRCWKMHFSHINKEIYKIPVNHNPVKLIPTQNLMPIYFENSCIYGFNIQPFLDSGGNRMCGDTLFMVSKFPENIDIDTEEDWNLACILQKHFEEEQ